MISDQDTTTASEGVEVVLSVDDSQPVVPLFPASPPPAAPPVVR